MKVSRIVGTPKWTSTQGCAHLGIIPTLREKDAEIYKQICSQRERERVKGNRRASEGEINGGDQVKDMYIYNITQL